MARPKDLDFTSEEIKSIVEHAPSADKSLAAEMGTTTACIKAMRKYAGQGTAKTFKAAAKIPNPVKVVPFKAPLDIDDSLFLKFGDSIMMLKKSEVSSIQISDGAVTIVN